MNVFAIRPVSHALGLLLVLVLLLGGCDSGPQATPTGLPPAPSAPPATALPTRTRLVPTPTERSATTLPTLTALPLSTPTPDEAAALPTLSELDITPVPDFPTPSAVASPPATPSAPGTPPPTLLPNPPELDAILEQSYVQMAALPGYTFTATRALKDYGWNTLTTLEGAYVRPDRLMWSNTVDQVTTQAVIVGPDYAVSLDGNLWTTLNGAKAALDEHRLWTTLHAAGGAERSVADDPDSSLLHLTYEFDAAHSPLPPQREPWVLLQAGVYIGRTDHLLHRIDLAAQTPNYLLEEHMYLSDFGLVTPIHLPEESTP